MRLKDHAPNGCINDTLLRLRQAVAFIVIPGGRLDLDIGMNIKLVKLVGQFNFIHIGKDATITLVSAGVLPSSGNTHPTPYLSMG